MTRESLLAFLRLHRYAVVSTVDPNGQPQAATVGVAVTDALDIVFDTLRTSRKAQNLRNSRAIALVFGSLDAAASRTVQLEGEVTFVDPSAAHDAITCYLSVFPDGRERHGWPDLTYVVVRPHWIRDSDYGVVPPRTVEWSATQLGPLP